MNKPMTAEEIRQKIHAAGRHDIGLPRLDEALTDRRGYLCMAQVEVRQRLGGKPLAALFTEVRFAARLKDCQNRTGGWVLMCFGGN